MGFFWRGQPDSEKGSTMALHCLWAAWAYAGASRDIVMYNIIDFLAYHARDEEALHFVEKMDVTSSTALKYMKAEILASNLLYLPKAAVHSPPSSDPEVLVLFSKAALEQALKLFKAVYKTDRNYEKCREKIKVLRCILEHVEAAQNVN